MGIALAKGVVEKVVSKGLEPKSRVRLVFTGPFRWTAADRVALEALTMVLEGQLGLVLREEQSGTYGVQVTSDTQRLPKPEYQIAIDFSCAPERTEELVKTAFAEIARLRFDGPTPKHVADTREAMLRQWETDSQENRYLLDKIADEPGVRRRRGRVPAGAEPVSPVVAADGPRCRAAVPRHRTLRAGDPVPREEK